MPNRDPLDNIVPLVLPTQLDSEDSNSENEEHEKCIEHINSDRDVTKYDEDIGGPVCIPSVEKEQIYGRGIKISKEEDIKVRNCEIDYHTEELEDGTFYFFFLFFQWFEKNRQQFAKKVYHVETCR